MVIFYRIIMVLMVYSTLNEANVKIRVFTSTKILEYNISSRTCSCFFKCSFNW